MARAMRVCPVLGCIELVSGPRGPCPAHATEYRRRYPSQNYSTAGWPRVRARYLRTHPDCECKDVGCRCGGICLASAVEVDHIIALRHFPDARVAHQSSNLQALCKSCHSSKTARHETGLGRYERGDGNNRER